MMNVDFKGIEIGDQSALTSVTLVPGRAVAKESTGIRPPSAASVRVLGLVKPMMSPTELRNYLSNARRAHAAAKKAFFRHKNNDTRINYVHARTTVGVLERVLETGSSEEQSECCKKRN